MSAIEPPPLLPCPFCGSSIVGELSESDVRDPMTGQLVPEVGAEIGRVGCGVCGAEGPNVCARDEYVERWNRRAGQTP